MTGGIALWKDRGYEVATPSALTRRAARALLAPPAAARGRRRGPAEAARREGAAARRGRARLADRALPRGRRRRHDRHRRQRRRRPLQPAAPGDPHDRPRRRRRRSTRPRRRSTRLNPDVNVVKYPVAHGRLEHHGDHRGLRRHRRRRSTTSRRAICSTTPPCGCRSPSCRASILGFEGQLSVFAPYEGPCYRCLFPMPPPAELAPSCGANGVLGVLPGTMGLLQATEVIKLIIGAGEPLIGRLLMYDALGATFTELKVRRDPECPICSREPDAISDEEMGVFPDYEAFCAAAGLGSRRYGHRPHSAGPARLRRRREGGRPPTARRVGEVLRRARRPPTRETQGQLFGAERRAQPLRQRLPQRRGRARARRAADAPSARATRWSSCPRWPAGALA